MKLDYSRDLEKAAKQMILVHRVDTLIRMILRTILKSLKIDHAGLLLYDKERDEYVVTVSRSRGGMKIPPGFAKIKKSNPLIRYFTDPGLKSFSREYLLADEIEKLFRSK